MPSTAEPVLTARGPGNTWKMELEIQRLLRESPAEPRGHLDQDRVRRYAEVLDQLPPVTVFELEDQTLLLVDGYHRVAAAQHAGRSTVRAEVRLGTKHRHSSSPSMSHRPRWACRLSRDEMLFDATAGGRTSRSARPTDSTAPATAVSITLPMAHTGARGLARVLPSVVMGSAISASPRRARCRARSVMTRLSGLAPLVWPGGSVAWFG
jgi:ParB-like nuclease domain